MALDADLDRLRAADGRAGLQRGHATEKISAIELPAE
jgi:hypothetical protein